MDLFLHAFPKFKREAEKLQKKAENVGETEGSIYTATFFKEKKRFFSQKEEIKTHASVHKLITRVSKELLSPFPSSHNSTVLFFYG